MQDLTPGADARLFILSIDGVPDSLARKAFANGRMPHLRRVVERGNLARMDSVIPVVSAVAWATFSTGVNPGVHGITGFVDRDPDLGYVLMTSSQFRASSLWKRLNEQGKRVIAINVPGTYPPEPIDGIMVGDFLSPTVEKSAYPESIVPLLKELKYIVDPHPRLAHEDKAAFMEQVFHALDARRALALRLLAREDWDVFMLHVMETDRVNHFYWEAQDDEQHAFYQAFWDFYGRVDELIGEVVGALDGETEMMVLSDHGFCGIRYEVDLNRYLEDLGYLAFREGAESLRDLDPGSVAYSLTPGRIYLNLKGREARGCVRDDAAPRLLEELVDALYGLVDPETGHPVIERVYGRDEIYEGPQLERAADLIAHPVDGYDLKAGTSRPATGPAPPTFARTAHTGMHTLEDAIVTVRGRRLNTDDHASILDMAPTIFQLLGLEVPHDFEGKGRLA